MRDGLFCNMIHFNGLKCLENSLQRTLPSLAYDVQFLRVNAYRRKFQFKLMNTGNEKLGNLQNTGEFEIFKR